MEKHGNQLNRNNFYLRTIRNCDLTAWRKNTFKYLERDYYLENRVLRFFFFDQLLTVILSQKQFEKDFKKYPLVSDRKSW